MDEEEEELSPETLALMSPAEINAFVKGREARRGGWQQRRRPRSESRKPTGARDPRRSQSAPGSRTQSRKLRCFNCGKEGHREGDCRAQRVEPRDRPCFDCGQKGHMA